MTETEQSFELSGETNFYIYFMCSYDRILICTYKLN